MEVAGLALGGIPILLYALDNYQRCLQPAKNFWKYESTLRTIRMNVFIQQEQLDTTLRNIGLSKPTAEELHVHLKSSYPNKADEFINILSHMDGLVQKLMDKLDVDTRGKPRWTTEPPERADWEWRRVRRSFGHREREALVSELQYWNDALRNVFEKQEIPSDESDPLVEELQAQFQPKHCDTIRDHLRLLHSTLSTSSSWGCQCGEHRGSLRLLWHLEKSLAPGTFSMGLQKEGVWHSLRMEVEKKQEAIPQSPPSPASAPMSPSGLPYPPSTSRRERLKQSLLQPWRRRSSSNIIVPLASLSPVLSIPQDIPINCLCTFANQPSSRNCGVMEVPSISPAEPRQHIRVESVTTKTECTNLTDLVSVLEGSQNPSTTHQSMLSRKDRLAVAAAAAWAALYLCGSPWIPTDWDGKSEIKLFVPDANPNLSRLGITKSEPAVSCVFKPPAAGHTISHTHEMLSEADRFQGNQIRNKTLFALGILLIELCLNSTFEKLRHETLGVNVSPALDPDSTVPDDFDVANRLADKVYLEAGYSYGYAVQRCLRCEFPGRDVTKSFEFSQFRRSFFNGVVAPVQATFAAQPVSCLRL